MGSDPLPNAVIIEMIVQDGNKIEEMIIVEVTEIEIIHQTVLIEGINLEVVGNQDQAAGVETKDAITVDHHLVVGHRVSGETTTEVAVKDIRTEEENKVAAMVGTVIAEIVLKEAAEVKATGKVAVGVIGEVTADHKEIGKAKVVTGILITEVKVVNGITVAKAEVVEVMANRITTGIIKASI